MQCRLCLIDCNEENLVPLFNNDEESNLTKLIAKYLYIEVTQQDALPKTLCKDCVQHLNEFHKFFQHVEQQQQVLQKGFSEGNSLMTRKLFEPETNLEHNEETLLDIKDVIDEGENCLNEPMSEKEFCYADDKLNTQIPHETESEEDVPLRDLLRRSNCKVRKKGHSKLNSSKCIRNSTNRKNNSKKLKFSTESQKKSNENDSSLFEELRNDKSKSYLSPEENKSRDEMVAKYVDLKCEICSVRVESYEELKIHFRKEHNRKAYIICCGTRFLRRFLLLDHIQSHLNPDRFKCHLCSKILKSTNSLNIHRKNKHADREKLKHACPLCNKRFQHLSNLNHHMFAHKKERDHICEKCHKGFKSNALLKVHIQRMHGERTSFVCETCGKEYRFKMSFDRHVAEHQGLLCDPTDKCPVCGKWYTLKNLKKHIKRHELEESKCEICGKTFRSKSSLSTHIGYAHSSKVFNCTLCDKSFKRASTLKEHIAMHTGRKDYNCPHCPREFRSKANMYSHVKKIHVEEWATAQMTRYQCPNTDIKKENK